MVTWQEWTTSSLLSKMKFPASESDAQTIHVWIIYLHGRWKWPHWTWGNGWVNIPVPWILWGCVIFWGDFPVVVKIHGRHIWHSEHSNTWLIDVYFKCFTCCKPDSILKIASDMSRLTSNASFDGVSCLHMHLPNESKAGPTKGCGGTVPGCLWPVEVGFVLWITCW